MSFHMKVIILGLVPSGHLTTAHHQLDSPPGCELCKQSTFTSSMLLCMQIFIDTELSVDITLGRTDIIKLLIDSFHPGP